MRVTTAGLTRLVDERPNAHLLPLLLGRCCLLSALPVRGEPVEPRIGHLVPALRLPAFASCTLRSVFHVYILRCADGSYYTGHTDNLELRIGAHTAGEFSDLCLLSPTR